MIAPATPGHRPPPPDQAAGLRSLLRSGSGDRHAGPAYAGPPLIAVAGAKGGVGVTTLTLKLASALASSGARAIAVDANIRLAGLAQAAEVSGAEAQTIENVIDGETPFSAAVIDSHSGVPVLPGARATPFSTEPTAADATRLLAAFGQESNAADTLVVDTGSGLSAFSATLWQAAAAVVLVTTGERLSLLGAYASIKLARQLSPPPLVTLLTNRVRNADEASRTSSAIGAACQQFLGLGARPVGFVAEGYLDEHVEDLAQRLVDRLTAAASPDQTAAAA